MSHHPFVRELPRGTVTFLFTDIEGSTRLLHELGAGYADVLAEHRRLLRESFGRHGGVEVDTQGDAFFVAFTRAADAVGAAREAQEALSDGPVRVRMGIHTGEPVVTDEGYVGMDVHKGARIMVAGHGGQILLSQTTQQLLDSAAAVRDLGEHRLKDLSAPERLFQVGGEQFPPLKTLHRTNLPIQPSPLIGRARELDEAGELIRAHRLLTLTGPGGSGKTRLSLQLAAEVVEDFPDGVYWVPLQALRDPALVERSIAASLGATGDLREEIGSKRLLLLLDNFEQVVEAASSVSALLAAAPHVRVLATSREPLRVEFEQRYPIEPLPDGDASTLFVERSLAINPAFEPTPAVAEICRRLDGLPLAIELAAARVALLTADDLLARLEKRLPLLTSRSHDAPERQRTLHAAIAWSYDLLEPEEQRLFRSLAVFRGSFTLEAAEAVCESDLDTIESLVEKSLVRRWSTGRLGQLETIRDYAIERIVEAGEDVQMRDRHALYYLDVARSANINAGKLEPGGQRMHIAIAEQDNVRGAIAWALENGEIELGLQIAAAFEQFWIANDEREGVRWFVRLFEDPRAASVTPEVRAHALRAYGSSADIGGDDETALRLYEDSLALFEELGDEHGRAVLLHRLGIQALRRRNIDEARSLVGSSHDIHSRMDNRWGLSQTLGTLGAIARDDGEEDRAAQLMAESAALAREVGVPWWEAGMLAELAQLALRAGRLDEAESRARESLVLAEQVRDRGSRVFAVGVLAAVAAGRGRREHAGRLWGAVEEEQVGAPLGGWRRHRADCAERIEAAAGPELEQGLTEGRELTLDEAVALALG